MGQGCKSFGLNRTRLRQPDLEWYFDTAATSAENPGKVLEPVRGAPTRKRRQEDCLVVAKVDTVRSRSSNRAIYKDLQDGRKVARRLQPWFNFGR